MHKNSLSFLILAVSLIALSIASQAKKGSFSLDADKNVIYQNNPSAGFDAKAVDMCEECWECCCDPRYDSYRGD